MLTLIKWAEKNAPKIDIQQLYVDAYKNHDGGQTVIDDYKSHEEKWAKHTIDEEYNWDDIDKITNDLEDINYHMFNTLLQDTIKSLTSNLSPVKTGWRKIEYTIEPDEYDRDHSAELIRPGFTEGEIVQEETDEE